ncbi:MAG: AEC family transporter [Gracilibacteraceae bacterium]|jgi:predicted permease|nr:AEC family transporter [Gracilibacteraceae bacterium]
MENFNIAVGAVAPLFLLMATGFVLFRRGLADDAFLEKANSLCFNFFLPVLIFSNIYHTEISSLANPRLLFFALGCLLALFVLLCLIIPLIEKDPRKKGVMVQGVFRSNFILMGVPIVTSVFPREGAGVVSLLVAVVIPLYNLLAVCVLEMFSSRRPHWLGLLRDIATNPLIVASLVSIAVVLSGLAIPRVLEKALTEIAAMAMPLALIALGGSFRFSRVGQNWRRLAFCLPAKLLLAPLLVIGLAVAAGFRGAELLALTVMFAAPVAVSSYQMALQADADADLAAQIVVFSTGAAAVTLVLFIYVLRALNLI